MPVSYTEKRSWTLPSSQKKKKQQNPQNPQCYQDYKAKYSTVRNYPREEQRKTRAVLHRLVWVFTVWVPIWRGTGGNKRTVRQTIPMATKEKDNVQAMWHEKQSQSDSDITRTLRERWAGRSEWRGKECVGRGAVIALLQEGALTGTEEWEPNTEQDATTGALYPKFEFTRRQEYF